MKILAFVTLIVFNTSPAFAKVVSSFTGPAKLKVWEHWQQSWNVEDISSPIDFKFKLERGYDDQTQSPFVSINFKAPAIESAYISCKSFVHVAPWEVREFEGNVTFIAGNPNANENRFQFNAYECLDKKNERIVTEIRFGYRQTNAQVTEFKVNPMYVRGKNQAYWDNPIDPYSAHAGSGKINVSTLMSGENGWDQWKGTLVKPVLNFIDRNTLAASSSIGLHRHEKNQEAYLIESGEALMVMGVSQRTSENYVTARKWEVNGPYKNVTEFYAEGGWVESRILQSNEIAVIVPNPNEPNTIYFHGLKALSNLVFWTMGSKN